MFSRLKNQVKITKLNHWFTKGIPKFYEWDKELNENVLKKQTVNNEANHKTCKSLFDRVKRNSNRIYYSDKYEDTILTLMKESIVKSGI